jgi:hypothetical protein
MKALRNAIIALAATAALATSTPAKAQTPLTMRYSSGSDDVTTQIAVDHKTDIANFSLRGIAVDDSVAAAFVDITPQGMPHTLTLRSTGDQRQAGINFVVGDKAGLLVNAMPAWVTVEKDQKPTVGAVLKLEYDGIEAKIFRTDMRTSGDSGWYVAGNPGGFTLGAGHHYDGDLHATAGYNVKGQDLGALLDVKAGSQGSTSIFFVAQNPSMPDAKAIGDRDVAEQFPEVESYKLSVARKTMGGLAARFDRIVKGDKAEMRMEVGLRRGDWGLSAGTLTEMGKTLGLGSVSYGGKTATAELKVCGHEVGGYVTLPL